MLKIFSVSWKTIIGCFVFLLLGGGWSISVQAQTLPAGGSGLETATAIQAGTYHGQLAPGADLYYKVEVKTGQEMDSKGGFGVVGGENTYSWGELHLYNGNKEELDYIYGAGGELPSWLGKAPQTMYFRITNNAFEDQTLTYNLEITLTNRFDANSQTDAGDTFETALSIIPGSYNGYLAGSPNGTLRGTDEKDIYKISLQKGVTYEFKLTPPMKDSGALTLYGLNRQILVEESDSPNEGALASFSFTPQADTSVFLAVNWINTYTAGGVFDYKVEIKSSVPLTKFYVCGDKNCNLTGDYPSLADCQTATAKTCYLSENCDGKCDGVTPSGCVKNSDCPADYPSCITGKCVSVPQPMCTKNSDCPANNVCENGKCVEGSNPPPNTCVDECAADKTKCFDNFNYNKCGDYNKDDCQEWSSPVYCGERNKCEGGKCVKAVGCQCSEWQGTECGISGCSSDKIAKTRTCAPAACDLETTCQEDLSCQVLPPLPLLPPSSQDWFGFFGGLAIWGWLAGLCIFIWLLFYIYLAICLQVLAKKTGTVNGWLAWIPIANVFLMISIAKKPLWWFLLLLIPLVNIVISIILWMAIAERRGKENWIGILIIIPVVGLGIPGYLAFSDKKKGEKIEIAPPQAPAGTKA
jgi:hypothetical protein